MSRSQKVILVGDECCGKVSLIFSLLTGKLPDPDTPIICKDYPVDIEIEGETVPMMLHKVPVQEHYSLIRTLSYPNSDAAIVFHSLDNPDSFVNATEKWIPEVREYLPDVPIVLLGSKMDLRTDRNVINRILRDNKSIVTFEEGVSAAEDADAQTYMECSAISGDGVKQVFQVVAKLILRKI